MTSYVPPPKDLTNFTKALSGEIRILLDEVGKLRDERRALQFEIAELMSLKSKHGAGGEYSQDWQPQTPAPGPENAMIPASVNEDGAPTQARAGWRVVHKRPARKEKPTRGAQPIPAAPRPIPVPNPDSPAWTQWRPNPLLSATPAAPASSSPLPTSPPARSGLFGPATPPPR